MSWTFQPFGQAPASGDQSVTAQLLTNAATFPNATITPGGVTVTGQLLTVTASLPNATVTTQNTITAQLLTNAATLPNATITTGNVNITANLLTVTASLPNATITQATPQTLENGLEGSNGTTLTGGSGGNTGSDGDYFDVINGSGTAPDAIVFDTSVKHGGSSSVQLNSTNTGNEYAAWTTQLTDTTEDTYYRAYIYITDTGNPDKNIRVYDSGGTEIAFMGHDAGLNFRVGDSADTFNESALTFSTSTWYRLELKVHINATTGVVTGRVFYGANLDGTTADEEWSLTSAVTSVGLGDVAQVRFANSIASAVVYMDDVGYSNVGWLGPRSSAQSISGNLLTATPTFPNATITTQNTITTNLLSVTASLPNSTVTAAATIATSLLSVSASLPNATVTPGGVTVAANLLSVTATLPNADISAGAADQTVTANLLTATPTLPNATVTASYTVTANLLTVTASLPNATVTAAATVSANLLTTTATFPLATFTGGLVIHILQNNANNGPDETQLTGGSGGNTGGTAGNYFDTINGGASPTPGDRVVFSSAQKAHGSFSIFCDSNSSGGEYFAWDSSWADETLQVDVRFYFRVFTFPSSAANKIMRMFDSLGNEVAYFRLDAAPNPGIGDSTSTFTEPSGPVIMSAGTWYRCEMHVPIGNSVTITCDLFMGSNMDGLTPDYSWSQSGSDTLTVGGDIASIRFGNSIAGTETFFDDVGIRNDGVAFGPATDTATISANLLSAGPSFPTATITTTATISTDLLSWPVTLPLVSFSQITEIVGELLDGSPTFPLASLSITGAQTVTGQLLTVGWQAFSASFTLGTINSPGSIEGSVGRRIITVGTVTELEDVAGVVQKG